MNVIEHIRQYFPDQTDSYLEHILWDETGYPSFWRIGIDGTNPIECFKTQVARAAGRENFGEYGYFDNDQDYRLCVAEEKARIKEAELVRTQCKRTTVYELRTQVIGAPEIQRSLTVE